MLYKRWTSFAGLLICIGLLCFAAYLQLSLNLQPCPLCVIQRILIALLGLVFLLGSLYTPTKAPGRRLHSLLIVIISVIGVLFAGRHVWLEHQPAGSIPTCSPSLEYMLQNLPLSQTLHVMLNGSGDCARVTWSYLGISIPGWTLILFILFALFGIVRYLNTGVQERH